MTGCCASQTRPRRAIVRFFPARPRSRPAARRLLRLARAAAGFAEWAQVRAETAAIELETILTEEARP